jgi:hypothetical protein
MSGWASSAHAGMASSGAMKQFLRELGCEHPAVFHAHLAIYDELLNLRHPPLVYDVCNL